MRGIFIQIRVEKEGDTRRDGLPGGRALSGIMERRQQVSETGMRRYGVLVDLRLDLDGGRGVSCERRNAEILHSKVNHYREEIEPLAN